MRVSRRVLSWISPLAIVLLVGACSGPSDPEIVSRLELETDSIFLTPGDEASLSAVPIGEDGSTLRDRASRVTWTVLGESVSSSSDGGVLTVKATDIGTAKVTAALGEAKQEGFVHVQPAGLARVAIFEGDREYGDSVVFKDLVNQGIRAELVAKLLDASGNEISPEGYRISWSISHEQASIRSDPNSPVARVSIADGPKRLFVQVLVGDVRTIVHIIVVE